VWVRMIERYVCCSRPSNRFICEWMSERGVCVGLDVRERYVWRMCSIEVYAGYVDRERCM
jgi:hypothetical protein